MPKHGTWSRRALRTLVSDLTDGFGGWKDKPPEALDLLLKALEIVRVSGARNGLPAETGRTAVDVVLEVCAGSMDIEDAIPALEYLLK